MRHRIAYLQDGFKKEPYCAHCGKDNPNEFEECPQSTVPTKKEAAKFVSGLELTSRN